MWPFSRRPKFQMPAWTFRSVDDRHSTLSLSLGQWLATDGAYLTKDAIQFGPVAAHEGSLDIILDSDGQESLTVTYKVDAPIAKQATKVLVIDSGEMVLCCENAFKLGGITLTDHRTSYQLHKAVRRSCPDDNVVLIHDADQHCIGIIVTPKWGDGAYRLEFDSTGELESLKIFLGESS
jgi:hypothetical protein